MVRLGAIAAVGTLALAGSSLAYFAPTLRSVTVTPDRHAVATFSASGADDATIYFANKPDRATDGRFFEENIKDLDFLTPEEIRAGRWVYEDQMDPGTYFVMLRASCYGTEGANCADGFSNIVTLTVPYPTIRYTTRITTVFPGLSVYAELRAAPLGEKRPYRVCYTMKTRRSRCITRTISGYSWNAAATDEVRVAVSSRMATVTTFTWSVDGRVVGRREVRVR